MIQVIEFGEREYELFDGWTIEPETYFSYLDVDGTKSILVLNTSGVCIYVLGDETSIDYVDYRFLFDAPVGSVLSKLSADESVEHLSELGFQSC